MVFTTFLWYLKFLVVFLLYWIWHFPLFSIRFLLLSSFILLFSLLYNYSAFNYICYYINYYINRPGFCLLYNYNWGQRWLPRSQWSRFTSKFLTPLGFWIFQEYLTFFQILTLFNFLIDSPLTHIFLHSKTKRMRRVAPSVSPIIDRIWLYMTDIQSRGRWFSPANWGIIWIALVG